MIKSFPTGSAVVVIVTVPEVFTVPEPRVTPPLVTMIVPVGPEGIVDVMVTALPKMLGPEVVTVTVGLFLPTD